jgi:hypothetical protein
MALEDVFSASLQEQLRVFLLSCFETQFRGDRLSHWREAQVGVGLILQREGFTLDLGRRTEIRGCRNPMVMLCAAKLK